MNSWRITETPEGVLFSLKIQPRASKNEICGLQGDALKVRLTAPPVEGEANEACIRFIAQWLNVHRNSVRITGGHTGRNKTVLVTGVSKDLLQGRLKETLKT